MSEQTSAAVALTGSGLFSLRPGGTEVLRTRVSPEKEAPASPDALAAASDEVLVARARAGESAAFEVLISRYQDRVYAIAHSYLRDSEDALDLAQEAFVKAYQGLHGFRGGSSFYTWLYRIVVNASKDYLRKRSARASLSLEDDILQEIGFEPASADRECDPSDMAETRELRDVVLAAVAALPEKLRLAVTLSDIEGLSQQEVAAAMGCPLGTVKSHVFRGRARLRQLLGHYIEGGE